MKKFISIFSLCILCLGMLMACGNQKKSKVAVEEQTSGADAKPIEVPAFNADSAYHYIEQQVAFGPRVPNTQAHQECKEYLIQELKNKGAVVTTQNLKLPTYTGEMLNATNIIGSFQPENPKRIALFSHWDSRPWADQDPDPKNHYKPILGANDGASGIGVLLELASMIHRQQPNLGIDLIFLDAEDFGNHTEYKGEHTEESWGLGAQAWARQPHIDGYHARFGILLDMVGGKNPKFLYDAESERVLPSLNRKVWKTAEKLGYGSMFIPRVGGEITDDHVFINRYANVPTIDIVPMGFFPHWHTIKDDMSAIDKNTLKAVGQTVANVIYNEK